MQTKTKNDFKAVEYMRAVRNELFNMLQNDKERFNAELKKIMADFLTKRELS